MRRDWLFHRRKRSKLLSSLQEKARQNPENCQVQVRVGDLLTKMGKKEAAIEAYCKSAENFAQHGFIVEAIAMSKVIKRLDPLAEEIEEKVSELYRKWEALKKKKSKPGNNPETTPGFG
jgi:cAMP-dependent protein kinase regulator